VKTILEIVSKPFGYIAILFLLLVIGFIVLIWIFSNMLLEFIQLNTNYKEFVEKKKTSTGDSTISLR